MDVSPKLRWNFFNSWRRWILTFASKADRGSSKSNKFGDVAMARANAILCCSPPDNWLGYFAEWSERPTKSSRLSTLFSTSTFVHAALRRPYAMFSKQERLGKSAYDWKTMPKSRWDVGRLENKNRQTHKRTKRNTQKGRSTESKGVPESWCRHGGKFNEGTHKRKLLPSYWKNNELN